MCVEWLVAVDIAVFAVFVLCDKKIAKSLAVSRILLTFAIELEQAEKNGCDEDSNE